MNPVVTLIDLLDAGVHFGHQTRRWNPKMFPYIYAERNGIHVIDLVQTAKLLTQACSFVQNAAENGKTFLFVGTKRQATEVIAQEARRSGSFYVNHRWLGGMLTNWETIKDRVQRLKDLEALEQNNLLENLPKKEAATLKRELDKLQRNLGGIKEMKELPDFAIIIDQKRETTAVQECLKLNIPIISIADTNCDPDCINVIIPGNDDAIRSVQLILEKLTDAICAGKQNNNEKLTV